MPRQPKQNSSPNKGFIDELGSDPAQADAKPAAKPFTWNKPVAGGETRPNQMNVPRRLNEQRKVGKPRTNLVTETAAKKNTKG